MLSKVMQKAVGHRSVSLISAAETARLIAAGGVAVLDANPPQRWRAIHVVGARNVDPAGYGRDELPADSATPLIFYCSGAGCGAAHYAARRAVHMGFSKVHVMTDGISGWSAEGRPVESGTDTDLEKEESRAVSPGQSQSEQEQAQNERSGRGP